MDTIFDKHYKKYDAWYDTNTFAYFSELEALKKILPKEGRGLEIGVGAGRFAAPLGITTCSNCYYYMFCPKSAEGFSGGPESIEKKGKLIMGIIDKNSFLGTFYRRKKSVFYKQARFFGVKELSDLLKKTGYGRLSYYQTLFTFPDKINFIQKTIRGFGKGGFVVISAQSD